MGEPGGRIQTRSVPGRFQRVIYAFAVTMQPPWAEWYDAQLTVLHVVPTFDPMQVRGDFVEPVRVVNPMTQQNVLGEMRRALDVSRVSPEATLIARAGDAQSSMRR